MKYTKNGLRYDFNPASKVIDFTQEDGFSWTNLFAIINLTAKTQIYGVGISGYGASADTTGKVLTLEFDTTAQSPTDDLMIIQDEGNNNLADILAAATGIGLVTRNFAQDDMTKQILIEMRLTNLILANIGSLKDELDHIRTSLASEID